MAEYADGRKKNEQEKRKNPGPSQNEIFCFSYPKQQLVPSYLSVAFCPPILPFTNIFRTLLGPPRCMFSSTFSCKKNTLSSLNRRTTMDFPLTSPVGFLLVQGLAKRWSPGLVHLVPALAYQFCLALAAAFTQPGARLLAKTCRASGSSFHRKSLRRCRSTLHA